jgi:tRNA-splicing ligase RtcB
MDWEGPLQRLDEVRHRVPESYKRGMRVPGIVYADDKLLGGIKSDRALEQVANVAFLPGIVKASFAMPDIHWGYGFPVGGVAAVDADEGVVSPGGIGFDINCGVRLIRTDLDAKEIEPKVPELADAIFKNVPAGVGGHGLVKLNQTTIGEVLTEGARWAVRNGFGWERDLERMEEGGNLGSARPECVSEQALKRGMPQLGSLGAGNHFLEIQRVEKIYDEETARRFGLGREGQVTVMVHTGSRGFGHQVATDHIDSMLEASSKRSIRYDPRAGLEGGPTPRDGEVILPDRQLACAPVGSKESQDYLGAMAAAANFGWANRTMIAHWVRKSFGDVLGRSPEELGMELVYDVAHNIAKVEEHEVDGKRVKVIVHRKGATRAFGPGRRELAERFRETGQPVVIPGDMGTGSFLLAGTEGAMRESFGTTCHGAGRVMSRTAATKRFRADQVKADLKRRGVLVRAASREGLVEEAPGVYKVVDDVVEVCSKAGLAKKVARLAPMAVVKG